MLEFGPGTSYLYPIDPSAYANGQCPDNLAADISRPCLLLMLLLAHKMGDHGKVSIRREDLALIARSAALLRAQ